jgi:hypothetical protein
MVAVHPVSTLLVWISMTIISGRLSNWCPTFVSSIAIEIFWSLLSFSNSTWTPTKVYQLLDPFESKIAKLLATKQGDLVVLTSLYSLYIFIILQ